MLKFRNSYFVKALCLYLAISFLAIGCDPNGSLLTNESIDQQAEEILDGYAGLLSQEECENFKRSIDDVKAYVWQQRSNGINPTRADIANYLYDKAVQDGSITFNAVQKQTFANFAQNNTWSGDQTAIINKLLEEQYFSSTMANKLHSFKASFSNVTSYAQAYAVIENTRNDPTLSTAINSQELGAFYKALDGAEKSVCYQEMSENDLDDREWCEECNWTLHWVALVISIVVTVVAWILAVVTLGLSTLVTSVVLVTVWTATWVLVCIWVWCDNQEACPEGQNPVCEGSFTFDPNIPACTNTSFPANSFEFGNCIMSPRPPSGICPTGSTPLGTNCLWECLTETPVQNSSGAWQIPFTCQ